MTNNFRLQAWLATLGLIPFVFLSICVALGLSTLPVLGKIEPLFSSYSLAIVVFMSGVHWGQAIPLENKQSRISTLLLVGSNIATIIAWLFYIYANALVSTAVMCGLFFLLLLIDVNLYKRGVIEKHYLEMRMLITTGVVISSIIFIFQFDIYLFETAFKRIDIFFSRRYMVTPSLKGCRK